MFIKDMNNKTRNSLEKAILESNIKKVVIHSEEPFIELYNGTIIWLEQIGNWINEAKE
jgi:hypothetical protein